MLKRVDLTSRSMVAMVEHGSCFAGVLAELLWSCDRSYMMLDEFEGDNRPLATVTLTPGNFGLYPMSNDLTRLQTRFLGAPEAVDALEARIGEPMEADAADKAGLITYAFDDIDWEDEVRIFLEERASFSPDAIDGDGSQPALCRARDDGNPHLWPPDCLAELDLPAAQRGGQGRRAATLRHRGARRIQHGTGLTDQGARRWCAP